MRAGRGVGPLALALWIGLAQPAFAQPVPLAPGREVRLFMRGVIAPFEGTLTVVSPDALTLTLLDGSEFTLSPAQLQRSEVLGTRRNVRRGAIVGTGVGIGVGIGLVVAARKNCPDQPAGYCDEFGDGFQEWPLIVAPIAGAAVGALVGHLIETPRWFPGFVPAASPDAGVRFGFAWSFPHDAHHAR